MIKRTYKIINKEPGPYAGLTGEDYFILVDIPPVFVVIGTAVDNTNPRKPKINIPVVTAETIPYGVDSNVKEALDSLKKSSNINKLLTFSLNELGLVNFNQVNEEVLKDRMMQCASLDYSSLISHVNSSIIMQRVDNILNFEVFDDEDVPEIIGGIYPIYNRIVPRRFDEETNIGLRFYLFNFPEQINYQWEVRTANAPGSDFNPANGYVVSGRSPINAVTLKIVNLLPSSTYYFYMRATYSDTNFSPFIQHIFTTLALSAPVAKVPVDSSTTKNSFVAFWEGKAGVENFRLDVSLNPYFTTFLAGYNDLVVSPFANKEVTGLSPDTVYFFRVRAYSLTVTGTDTSPSSNTISVKTKA